MGAWRGSSHIHPGATMTAALRIVRDHAPRRADFPERNDVPGAEVPGAESRARRPARPRSHLAPWARSGVRHPNPRMSEGLVARLLHP
jgi:hypothetical protein